ncbi:MAG: GNAT family N-acetyltransferase [Candidatus Izemoplasma sp.]
MKIVVAKSQTEVLDNLTVRTEVFIIGQTIDWQIEFDGLDRECILFTAYKDDIAVGAARLYKNKVGRVAVLKEYRGQGFAVGLMNKVEEYAKDNKFGYLKLNAQVYVEDFYKKLGYVSEGEIFQEADIDHILMTKKM